MNRRKNVPAAFAAAVLTQIIWGVLPLYGALYPQASPFLMLAHRIIWCALATVIVTFLMGEGAALLNLLRAPRRWAPLLLSAGLLCANWLLFFMAIQHGRIIELSMAYYILPLLTIGLGVVFLAERLNAWQCAGLAASGLGVTIISLDSGGPPWLGLAVAGTFSCYTLVRKKLQAAPAPGFSFETIAMLPVAGVLFAAGAQQHHAMMGDNGLHFLWLFVLGPQTTLTMILFNFSAKRLRMATIGVVQFLSPSIAFLTALSRHEHIDAIKTIGFASIWVGVGLYIYDALKRQTTDASAILS